MANKNTTIPKGWKVTTLGKALYPISDTFKFNGTERVHFLNTGDILEGKLLHKNLSSTKTLPGQAKKRFKLNDILYSEIRPANKRYMLVNFESSNSVASTKLMVLRTKENVDVKYIYKFITFRDTINQFQVIAESRSGTFPQITFDSISNIEFVLPPLPEQRAIAAVLSSLDDKIELLREQNKTLEATAQAIFKEWFVNFNFPGATGKMIDSELGEIPEGWRVGKIKDLIDILSGFAFSSSDFSQDGNYKLVTIKNVQDRHFDPETKDRLSALPVRMPEYCKLNSGDILLSLTGNVGRICLVNGDNFLLNQRVAKLKEKNPSDYAFTYLLFLQDSIFSLLQSTASGTAQQNLSPIQTKEIEIIIADRKTLDQFGMVANKLIQKINDNNSQVETLSKLRDTLLPKLMTGNVRVKGFED